MSTKIGLIGLAGSGKDTAAVIIQKILAEQGKHFEIDRYAGLLKECARQVFGENFDDRDVKEGLQFVTPELHDKIIDALDYCQMKLGLDEDAENKFWYLYDQHMHRETWMSPRKFQQVLGTEIGRGVDPLIWVKYLQGKDQDLIIPDVRFGSEDCDFNILITRYPVPQGTLHASEVYAAELQLIDEPYEYVNAMIHNGGTLEELETKLRFVLTTFKL